MPQRQPEGKLKDACRKIAVAEGLIFWNVEGKSINGVPDTLCSTVTGAALLVEFKVPGKEPSEQQWQRIYDLRQAGVNAWYATSVEEWEMLVGLRPSTIVFAYTARAKRAIGLA